MPHDHRSFFDGSALSYAVTLALGFGLGGMWVAIEWARNLRKRYGVWPWQAGE